LLKPGSLHFFEDGNIYSGYEFELDGILNEGIELEGLEISLTNRRGQSCKLQFANMALAHRWHCEL
jgi:hypothetical protein